MNRLRNLVRVYTGNKSVITLFALIVALEGIFLVRTVFPSWFEVALQKNIFEIVVLLALSQALLLLLRLVEQPPQSVCDDEYSCQDMVRRIVREDPRASLLKVSSAGLGSRYDLITSLSNAPHGRIRTHVIAQNHTTALDRADALRTEKNMFLLNRGDHENAALEVRFFDTPATIRSFIICDSANRPYWGIVSWYIYHTVKPAEVRADGTVKPAEVRVVGRRNPAIVLRGESSPEQQAILTFLDDTFNRAWADCGATPGFRGKGI